MMEGVRPAAKKNLTRPGAQSEDEQLLEARATRGPFTFYQGLGFGGLGKMWLC